jgi:hypothetical protein
MTKEELENYVRVASGHARVIRASKPTRDEQVVNRMVTFARPNGTTCRQSKSAR